MGRRAPRTLTTSYRDSGLVDCGWEYEQVKAFIQKNNSLKQLAA